MTDEPGLLPQSCPAGECVVENPLAARYPGSSTEVVWSLPRPYPSNFSYETTSSSDADHYAVFPGPGRPTRAIQQDFTLLGGEEGEDVHVRAFKVERKIQFTGSDQKEQSDRIVAYAVGAEFMDQDESDNIVIPYEDYRTTEGQEFCRRFTHRYSGDSDATDHMVLLVDPDKHREKENHPVLAAGPPARQR